MKKVLIFPAPFLTQKTTADQQNDYMFSLLKDEVALERIGDFIEVNTLNKSDYCEEVRRIIARKFAGLLRGSSQDHCRTETELGNCLR